MRVGFERERDGRILEVSDGDKIYLTPAKYRVNLASSTIRFIQWY